jgi:hypothetical protein
MPLQGAGGGGLSVPLPLLTSDIVHVGFPLLGLNFPLERGRKGVQNELFVRRLQALFSL